MAHRCRRPLHPCCCAGMRPVTGICPGGRTGSRIISGCPEIMRSSRRAWEAVRGYYAPVPCGAPNIAALAACEERRLTKLWEGLGYYSRVRNLQKAAQVIVSRSTGRLPRGTMGRSGRCPVWRLYGGRGRLDLL